MPVSPQNPVAFAIGDGQFCGGESEMKLYRINKLAKPGGAVVKKKDVLASNDREAVKDAADSDDCPVCDIYRNGEKVGSIV